MLQQTLSILAITAAIVVVGAGCSKKATVTVNNTNVSVNVPLNTTVIPSGTTTGDFSTGSTTTSAKTVTITAAGVSPKTLTVAVGTTVSFVNEDTIAHQVSSDPHPSHTGLPGFDNTAASQSYTFTFSKTGSFGYHDHLDPFNSALKGTIIVQ